MRRKYLRQKESSSFVSQNKNEFISVGLIFLLVCSLFFAFSGVAMAQENQVQEKMIPVQMNPALEDVAKELRCPTCLGISILESQTPQSQAMKFEIAEQLRQGKSKIEIINYYG